jgi:GTP-dependent phosphoenolpyruvate carboxykinase
MTVDPAEQARELDDAEVFLSSFGAALPAAITAELEETRRRLLS